MQRLLSLSKLQSNTAILANPQSRKPFALPVALVLCLCCAFVLSSNEAWAKEQPSSAEQHQPKMESTTIVNGSQVAEPAPTPVSPPVSPAPSVETPPPETIAPSPSESAPPKAAAEPAPLQQTVVITTTGGETASETDGEAVQFSVEPVPAYRDSEPAPTGFASATMATPTTTPASVSVSADPTAAGTPDLGIPEIDIPAVVEEAQEVPAALLANLSPPSEVAEPVIPGSEQQQVSQGVVSQEQVLAGYRSSGIASGSPAVQPLAQAFNNVLVTSASAAASAVAGVLGTVGGWLSEVPSSGADSSSSSGGTTPEEPFVPVSPEPLGSSFISLFSGGGQTSAGGAGAPLLLGVLFLGSLLLLRRDFMMYLVSIELPKPSSAVLSPLERPG